MQLTHTLLPISLVLFLQIPSFACQADPSPSLVPPSTFGNSSTLSAPPGSSTSASGNGTSTASATSTAMYPSLSGYPPCVSSCLALSASSANCSSEIDVNCYCIAQSTRFTAEIVDCISTQCFSELSAVESLAEKFCALANTSTSLSFPTATAISSSTTSPKPSSTRSSTAPSSTAPSTSAKPNSALQVAKVGFGVVSSAVISVSIVTWGVIVGVLHCS